jgi:hypothetical protein
LPDPTTFLNLWSPGILHSILQYAILMVHEVFSFGFFSSFWMPHSISSSSLVSFLVQDWITATFECISQILPSLTRSSFRQLLICSLVCPNSFCNLRSCSPLFHIFSTTLPSLFSSSLQISTGFLPIELSITFYVLWSMMEFPTVACFTCGCLRVDSIFLSTLRTLINHASSSTVVNYPQLNILLLWLLLFHFLDRLWSRFRRIIALLS